MATWTPTFPLAEIPTGGARLYKDERHRVALFRVDEQVYAVDNACPHEGYPLVQGTVSGCVLTCIWHNFKFDLRDGSCVMGEEAVRHYATRVQRGVVEIDLSEPELGPRIAARWVSLEGALRERRMGQAIRDTGRLLQDKVPPEQILAWLAAYDGLHAEDGSSHALAVAADALHLLPREGGLEALTAISQVLDLVSEVSVRRAPRELPAPEAPSGDAASFAATLRKRVEAEDSDGAEALVRGAVAAGWRRDELRPAFLQLCADHFLDFGHSLIYTTKVFDLLDAADWAGAGDILGGLVFNATRATREDLLPEWAAFRKRVDAVDLSSLWRARVRGGPAWWDREGWLMQLLDGKPSESLAGALEALQRGVPPADLIDALVVAASERILRFDVRIDQDPKVQNGWLDVTHILTFCSAVRQALETWDDPQALRLLLQAVHFVRKQRPLDRPEAERSPIRPQRGDVQDVLDAITRRDADQAIALAAGLDSLADLEAPLTALSMGDGAVRPVVVAHLIKTTRVAFVEHRALQGDPRARHPVLAALRLLASPVRERRVGQLVAETRALLEHGKPPTTLC